MSETNREYFWKFFAEHTLCARHYESQRSTVSTLLLAITGALITAITFDKSVDRSDIPICVFVIFVGLFGSMFAMKHHERIRIHFSRAKAYRDALDKTLEGKPILFLKEKADSDHDVQMKFWREMKDRYWWVCLNLLVAMIGISLLLIAWQ